MRLPHTRLDILVATFAVALLGASPVEATPTKTPGLAKSGLQAPTSKPKAGVAAEAEQLEGYAKTLAALHSLIEFKSTAPNTETMGPVTLERGADITFSTSIVRENGQPLARVESVDLEATGVRFGPSLDVGPVHTGPLLSLTHVTLDSKGAVSVKLNHWLPEVTISRVEHSTNGDTILHGASWQPPVTIHKNGDVTVTLGYGRLSKTVKLANVQINPFTDWPPTAPELEAGIRNGIVQALEGKLPKISKKLSGTLTYKIDASAQSAKGAKDPGTVALDADGISLDLPLSGVDLTTNGSATIGGGKLTGDAALHLAVGDTRVKTKTASVDLPAETLDLHAHGSGAIDQGAVSSGTAELTGKLALAKAGSVKATLPGGSPLQARLDSGTEVSVDATVTKAAGSANTQLAAKITGELGAEPTVSAKLGPAQMVIHSKWDAGVDATVAGTLGPGGKFTLDTTKTRATVPVKVGVEQGTSVKLPLGTSVTLTNNDSSSVTLTGAIALDANGHPKLQELDDVDVVLSAGPAKAMVLGASFTVPAGNQVRIQGKAVFGPTGLDVSGTATLGLHVGPFQPTIHIDF